jgi:hypothetical protein
MDLSLTFSRLNITNKILVLIPLLYQNFFIPNTGFCFNANARYAWSNIKKGIKSLLVIILSYRLVSSPTETE